MKTPNSHTVATTFWQHYSETIIPKLKEIDTALKCQDTLTIYSISQLLDLNPKETASIIINEKIKNLDKDALFKIMDKGSSDICQMYHREKSLGSPFVYTKKDIAFIYQIDIALIEEACALMNYDYLTSNLLPSLFIHIPYKN